MNTNGLKINSWKLRDEVLKELIEHFGSMNKNDYELALFHLLLENEFATLSDYEISVCMKIPESKVKRLRYEVKLRYSDNSVIEKYKNELSKLLLSRKYRIHNDRIQFAISDKMFRLFLNDLLMKDGRFADTSFNVNVVSMTADDLLFLISEINAESGKLIKKMKSDFKDKETELPKGVIESLVSIGKETVMTVVEKATTELLAKELEVLVGKIIDSVKQKLSN